MGKEYMNRLNSQENLNNYLNGTLDNTRNLVLEKYQSQQKLAGEHITIDPNERYKTEMQKQYTDKNISRLLLKAAGNISD